jgi:hypothetical protein
MNNSVYTAWGTPIRGSLTGLVGSEPQATILPNELYALSEFYLGDEKPEPAATMEPKVKTGTARDLTMVSVIITDSSFADINLQDVVETGIMYHGQWLDFSGADRQAADPLSMAPVISW